MNMMCAVVRKPPARARSHIGMDLTPRGNECLSTEDERKRKEKEKKKLTKEYFKLLKERDGLVIHKCVENRIKRLKTILKIKD